ncbi:MAG: T9SS type A sorting domain-containing protein [Chitinophagales bacterium]|nr:T9SS type A sorting domain-containing protein [Chitinophagales bacterium]
MNLNSTPFKKMFALLMSGMLFISIAVAQTNTWLGNSTQWGNTANWSLGSVPNSNTADVLIPSAPTGGFFPQAALPISVRDIEMQNGATASFNLSLSVYGTFTGGATSPASISGNGSVIFAGTVPQDIYGKCTFKKAISNNTSNWYITIYGDVTITESWTMQRCDIWNNGTFTLKSDANGTAYLDFFTYLNGGSFNGNLTAQLYIANSATGYRDISLPVYATVADVADDFSVTGPDGVNCWYAYSPYPTLQEYREDANVETDSYYGGFWSFTAPGNVFTPGRGYAARIYNAPLTLDVSGTPNYGMQLLQLTNTPSGNPQADGWNLIGNPYPVPIKWSVLSNSNPGTTDGTCYRFTTSGEYAGSWSAHNGVTGVPNGTPDEISMFQGFFVHVPATNYLFIDHNACTPTTTAQFFKTDELSNEVRLQLTNGTHADEIVAYTDASATGGYDTRLDALKMPATGAVNLSFALPNDLLAINVLDDITAQTELPLTISVTEDGNYTLNALALNVGPLTAYLKDALTNTLYDLSNTSPSLGLVKGQVYSNRFSIVFKQSVVSGIAGNSADAMQIYTAGNTVVVQRNSTQPAQINVFNVLGQQVQSLSATSGKTDFAMPQGSGYLLVKVTQGSVTHTGRVLITN